MTNMVARGQEGGAVRPGGAEEGVLCPTCEDTLVRGFKERPDVAAFVFQKGRSLACGGDQTGCRETDGRG